MNLEDFVFEKVEGGYALTEYTGKEKEIEYVEIPESFLGEPVVEIGENAFYRAVYLEEIKIPSTVTTIRDRCFWACEYLEEILIPDSVTILGRRVFDGCKSLAFIRMPEFITKIPSGFCQYCENLMEVILPCQLKVIGEAAFFHCHSLYMVRFSQFTEGVWLEKIECQAFDHCRSLKDLNFPSAVKKLGDLCFAHCESLETISLGHTEVVCGKDIFKESYNIQKASVVLVKHLEKQVQCRVTLDYLLEFDALSPPEQKTLLDNVKKRVSLQQFLFSSSQPDVVATLLWHKFHPTLEEVDAYLVQSIEKKSMETNAMLLNYKETRFSETQRKEYQQRLEFMEMGFEIPTRSEFWKKWVYKTQQDGVCIFGYKGVGTEETIPSHFEGGRDIVRLMQWKEHHFYQLEKIVMESGIRFIHKECFANHPTLKEVVLPPTLEVLEEFVFYGCVALEEIEIPASVTVVESYALSRCTSLKRVVFLGDRTKIHPTALEGNRELEYVGDVEGRNLLFQFTI